MILLLLVGQFNSIRRPIIILTTIPLGVIGVTIGLVCRLGWFGGPFGYYAGMDGAGRLEA